MERKGSDIFVYLTMINNGDEIMKNIQVIDSLSNDAVNLIVFTPSNLLERMDRSLMWEICYLGVGAKKIFHYKMNSKNDRENDYTTIKT